MCTSLEPHARHLFSTRALRYRGATFADDRCRVATTLAVAPEGLVSVAQVHGGEVVRITASAHASGIQADALVTTDPTIAVSVVVADCVPVLIGDRQGRVVAAVHAGWRGTAAHIVPATIAAIQKLGMNAADLVAAIGPSIGPCCYQVDAPVLAAFRAGGAVVDEWFTPDGPEHWRLDLWKANRDQLIRAGLPASSVHVASVCTADHLDVCWSYRREGAETGRMVAAISRSA